MISNSITGANAQYYTQLVTSQLQKSDKRLASGNRLAALEDAAGIAVSNKLDSVIGRLGAASEAGQNLISFSQTSVGVLGNVSDGLSRMSELALRATNGALSDSDRALYNTEYTQLRDAISTQIGTATFNGTSLFDTTQNINAPIDSNGSTYQLHIPDAAADVAGLLGTDISTAANAQSAIGLVDTAIENIGTSIGKVAGDISTVSSFVQNLELTNVNTQATQSSLTGLDYGRETIDRGRLRILEQASIAVTAQANLQSRNVLRLLQ
jgi:flagellin